jgi:anti-sigma factor RsiW
MDHHEAVQIYAAAAYVLEELTEPERDAFEDHFFSCPACAEELQTTAQFLTLLIRALETEDPSFDFENPDAKRQCRNSLHRVFRAKKGK